MSLFLALCLFFSAGLASADDLEEAVGLPEVVESVSDARTEDARWKWRSYILVESLQQRKDGQRSYEFPDGELSASLDYNFPTRTDLFLDGQALFNEKRDKTQGFINQIGVRQTVNEQFVLALGKERNRRAPGLIVAPSDLLFSLNPLPGQREDRRGLWSARLSYQEQQASFDLIVLPVDEMSESGFPASEAKYSGSVIRSFYQFGLIDVGFSLGSFSDALKAGLAVQSILENTWRLYYDGGYQTKHERPDGTAKKHLAQHLVGLGYEGSDDFGLRVEYFLNGLGLNKDEFGIVRQRFASSSASLGSTTFLTPFVKQRFVIISANVPEAFHRFNFFLAMVGSLEDTAMLNFFRTEYLANDHFVVGASQLFVRGNDDSQYAARSFDTQTSLDLKYSF